jgi:hypothetical protein
MKFMLITNDASFANFAVGCGVERIFVDLEIIGKKERQGNLDTFISSHDMSDVSKIKDAIKGTSAELLVRLNPFYENTKEEVDEAISLGADILMLPMFTEAEQVRRFCCLVNGRVKVMPLVETAKALSCMDEIVKVLGVDEIFIGLNDLSLDLGLRFMFEPLASGLLDRSAAIVNMAGLPFGFGGIARVCEGMLPAENILGEHLRLGSSSVILSRTFNRKEESDSSQEFLNVFKREFRVLKDMLEILKVRNSQEIEQNHSIVVERVEAIKELLNVKKQEMLLASGRIKSKN